MEKTKIFLNFSNIIINLKLVGKHLKLYETCIIYNFIICECFKYFGKVMNEL